MSWIEALKRVPVDLGQGMLRETTEGKRIALRRVPDGVGRTALDVGCRDGTQSEWLRSCGYDVTSVDIQACHAQCLVVDVNRGLPFDDGRFDMVWCTEVVEHLDSPSHFAREARRILKPGGRLLLTTPNSAFWFYPVARLFGKAPRDLQNSTHKHFFSERDVRELFPDAELLGFFPYFLIKCTIRRAIGLLSPTFVVLYDRPR